MSGVVRMYTHGGPEVLKYESETLGEPAPGQVLLRQEAIGVNFVDTYFRSGAFPLEPLPAVLGVEGAGVVEAVGPGVSEFSVGDARDTSSSWAVMRPRGSSVRRTLFLYRTLFLRI